MKLTLLGTGDWRIDHPVASAGYVVQYNNTTVKLDFGRGNLLNMAKAGIDWKSIDAIFISHPHPDHISDLFQYLQAYTLSHDDGTLTKQVPIYGPKGFKNYFEQLRRTILTVWDHIPEVHELYDETITIGDLAITAAPTQHVIDNIAVRIEGGGKSLCYTGDAARTDQLTELARGADLLLTECYSQGRDETEGHMGTEDVAQLVNESGVKQVVLTHYIADPAQRQARAEGVAAGTPVSVTAGTDLQVIEL